MIFDDSDNETIFGDERHGEIQINESGIKMKSKSGKSVIVNDDGITILREESSREKVDEDLSEPALNRDSILVSNAVLEP